VASWFALREYAQVCKEQYGGGVCVIWVLDGHGKGGRAQLYLE
jgi:hypothetical protein